MHQVQTAARHTWPSPKPMLLPLLNLPYLPKTTAYIKAHSSFVLPEVWTNMDDMCGPQ